MQTWHFVVAALWLAFFWWRRRRAFREVRRVGAMGGYARSEHRGGF